MSKKIEKEKPVFQKVVTKEGYVVYNPDGNCYYDYDNCDCPIDDAQFYDTLEDIITSLEENWDESDLQDLQIHKVKCTFETIEKLQRDVRYLQIIEENE